MNITFKREKVKVGMKKHILKAINTFSEDITRDAATPATSFLFKTREADKLDEKKAETFHSVVASLLFISRRCRLDIQIAVAFLCTRIGTGFRRLEQVETSSTIPMRYYRFNPNNGGR